MHGMSRALDNKIAVITGAASGIGEASVARFVAEGAFVFVVDRSGREAQVAARHGEHAEAVNADVTSVPHLQQLFKRVEDRFGRLDILFNNAGTGGARSDIRPLAENTDDNIENMIAVNVRAVLFAIKYATPLLIKSGCGAIINTASTAALIAHPNMAAYAAAKGGIPAMTRALARELGPQHIRVNTICPGPIETPLLTYYMKEQPLRDHLIEATAMKRLGRPDEIAAAAVFLASAEASYITGATLPVDGGQSA
jgi:NAD(P)-dependent dehydrogenase (short-subunit alcohol dehydrogenase family)